MALAGFKKSVFADSSTMVADVQEYYALNELKKETEIKLKALKPKIFAGLGIKDSANIGIYKVTKQIRDTSKIDSAKLHIWVLKKLPEIPELHKCLVQTVDGDRVQEFVASGVISADEIKLNCLTP
ncbi:MAG: hypothetical protein WCQ47_08995, partial [bacterium]